MGVFIIVVSALGVPALAQADAARSALAQCRAQTNTRRFAEAQRACDRAVAQQPASAEALRARAELHFVQERYDLAISDLDAALEATPELDGAIFLRGMAHKHKGEDAKALLDVETALLLSPGNAEYLNSAGALARSLRQHEKALGFFDRALALKADSVPALMGRGFTLREKGDAAGALEAFDAAVKAAPQETQPLHWRGHLLASLKNTEKALVDFEAALAISPRSADILCDRGDLLLGLNRHDEALAAYDKAIATDPAFTRAIRSRAVSRFKADDFLGARIDLELAHKQNPDPNTAKYLEVLDTALALGYRGPLEEARDTLREASPGGIGCASELASVWTYERGLRDAAGNVDAAEQKLMRDGLGSYRKCLAESRAEGAGAVDGLPALRLKLVELLKAQAVKTEELKTRCAARPEAKETCASLLKDIADASQKVRADQKLLESATLALGGDVARLEADAPGRVAAAIEAARAGFAARAAASYDEEIDRGALARHSALVRKGSVNTIYSTCGSIRLSAPRTELQLDAMNQQLSNHRKCLQGLGKESSSAGSDFADAHEVLDDAIEQNAVFKAFRCSVRPGPGCVKDEAWSSVQGLATPELRSRALTLSAMAGKVPDEVDAELTRINDAVKRLNSEIESHNTWADVSAAVSAFTDAFNAASPSNRAPSNFSAPGIR
ncbi:tetratricopeptide repeat protein [Myxococcus sp. QH3KD-4-1]|nr:tetratricopeptide repeat protein [Myxococcus qinghaiensis]